MGAGHMPPFPVDPKKDTVCDVIRCWADVQPNAPVFVEEDKVPLTYAGLVCVMDHVRDTLWTSGLGLGDRIGVFFSNSVDLAAGLVGVTGFAAAVPLDPRLKIDEAMGDLRDREVKALISEVGLDTSVVEAAHRLGLQILDFAPQGGGTSGDIKFCGSPVAVSATPSPKKTAGPDDIHMVFTTSGTTGEKRVVLVYHRRRMRQSSGNARLFELSPDDRHLLMRPLYYPGGRRQDLRPPHVGGQCRLCAAF